MGRWHTETLERLQRFLSWARPGTLAAAALGFPIFFVLSSAILTFGRAPLPPERATQPIQFNHRLHVQDVGLDCADCHQYYETETFSGLPSAEVCAMCHEEAQTDRPEEVKLAGLLSEGVTLDWKHLFRQPSHVYFSHRRHVAVAELECSVCHGDFASSVRPPRKVKILDMDTCVDCHEQQQASIDCTHCHR